MEFAQDLDRHRQWYEALYQDLHAHPELSNREHRTARLMAELAREAGYEVHEQVGESTGVAAILRNGEGPTVLLRADMDGLPVTEIEQVPYRSLERDEWDGQDSGVMHACGHDTHMTALQGALRVLADRRDEWSGTILAVFQPAEELIEGAKGMTLALRELIGSIDVALGQHIMAESAGTVHLAPGAIMATSNQLRITVHGRGGHGSQPHNTIDPIVTGAAIVTRLQSIVAREVAPEDRAVVTVGTFHAGTKANIIPAEAVFEVNTRTFDDRVEERVIGAVTRIVRAECEAAATPEPPTIEQGPRAPLTVNDADATTALQSTFDRVFGEDHRLMQPRSGSEDFAFFGRDFGAPSVFWTFGGFDPELVARAKATGQEAELIPSNHAPTFIPVMQPTLDTAVRAMSAAALTWLQSGADAAGHRRGD